MWSACRRGVVSSVLSYGRVIRVIERRGEGPLWAFGVEGAIVEVVKLLQTSQSGTKALGCNVIGAVMLADVQTSETLTHNLFSKFPTMRSNPLKKLFCLLGWVCGSRLFSKKRS